MINGTDYLLHHHPVHEPIVTRIFEIINDSVRIISTSKNLETIDSRFALIEDNIISLSSYATKQKEIDTFKSALLPLLQKMIETRYYEMIKEAVIKSKNAKTKRGKISPIEKVLTYIELYKASLSNAVFEKLTDRLNYALDYIEAEDLYDAYKKYEFKGNIKKAEDLKKELEYFLLKAHADLRNIDISTEYPFVGVEILAS